MYIDKDWILDHTIRFSTEGCLAMSRRRWTMRMPLEKAVTISYFPCNVATVHCALMQNVDFNFWERADPEA